MIGRRRFVRFPLPGKDSCAFLAEAQDEDIHVRNVAYGGLCVELSRPLLEDGIYQFWLELGSPFHEIVFATTQVRWVSRMRNGYRCGVQVLETNRTWLGPVAMWRTLPKEEVQQEIDSEPPDLDFTDPDYPLTEAVSVTRGSRAKTSS